MSSWWMKPPVVVNVAENFRFDEPDSYFSGRGGGIGQGLPGALGTQLGLPDKRVVCISGDGSAMYSIQSLWTAAATTFLSFLSFWQTLNTVF